MSNATVPPAVAPAFVAAAPSIISDNNANVVVPIPDFPIQLPVDYDPYSTSVNVTLRETASCPAGYICNTTHQASCFDIRQAAVDYFKYGDIHAGAYCPEGSPFYLECPLGSYCPDPVSRRGEGHEEKIAFYFVRVTCIALSHCAPHSAVSLSLSLGYFASMSCRQVLSAQDCCSRDLLSELR